MEIPITLAAKLGAIVVHAEEMFSPDGHEFDRIALQQGIADDEVQAWIGSLGPLVPVKRSKEGR